MNVSFFIPGIPVAGGSKTGWVPRRKDGSYVTRPNGSPAVVIMDSGKAKNKEWKQQCAVFARQNYRGAPNAGPLRVTFKFYRTRPKAHFKSDGVTVKDSFKFTRPTTKPDVTKLVRAAEDGMTGILWVDDTLIVEQFASKEFSDTPGLAITVEEISVPSVLIISSLGATSSSPQAALL